MLRGRSRGILASTSASESGPTTNSLGSRSALPVMQLAFGWGISHAVAPCSRCGKLYKTNQDLQMVPERASHFSNILSHAGCSYYPANPSHSTFSFWSFRTNMASADLYTNNTSYYNNYCVKLLQEHTDTTLT